MRGIFTIVFGAAALMACDHRVEVGSTLNPGPSGDATVSDVSLAPDGGSVTADGGLGADVAVADLGVADGGLGLDGMVAEDGGLRSDGGLLGDGGGLPDGSSPPDTGPSDGGVSGPVFQGSFVVTNQIDRATILPYAEITGDLDVAAPGLATLALPNLVRVGGHLTVIGNNDLTQLELPALASIGTDLKLYDDPVLTELILPSLQSIGESVRIGLLAGVTARTNRMLERIEMPLLTEVGGQLQIRQNGITIFDLLTSQDGLKQIILPSLVRVGYGLEIVDNLRLLDFELTGLADVDQRSCIGLGNCLVIHDVAVVGNSSLPECRVRALNLQLRARGYPGGFSTGSNDDNGVCN